MGIWGGEFTRCGLEAALANCAPPSGSGVQNACSPGVNLAGAKNQAVAQHSRKDLPGFAGKILLGALTLVGLSACASVSVRADGSSNASAQRLPMVAPAGSVLRVRLDQDLDSRRSRPGDRFTGTLDSPLNLYGTQILSKGTVVTGHVLMAHPWEQSRDAGRAVLSLTLDSCRRGGREFGLSVSAVTRVGKYDAGADSTDREVSWPAGSIVAFTLRSPLVISEVSSGVPKG
jgi:hypothetical protein